MQSHSTEELQRIADDSRGRIAIYREGMVVARVGIAAATVVDDVLAMTVKSIATRGLNAAGIPYEVGAHGSLLFASPRYLAATYTGWQLYLDDTVVADTVKIVSTLGAGRTYRTDYVSTPAATHSRFTSTNKPGTVAGALFDFLHRQQSIELRDMAGTAGATMACAPAADSTLHRGSA